MPVDISVYDSAETEAERIARFHEFIEGFDQTGYTLERTSDDQYTLTTDAAKATVNFWDDIIELNVINLAKDEEVFALHFQLRDDDWEHGEDLYGEMVAALLAQQARKTVDVLLTCSSAMTTTLFAQKLDKVAKTMGRDYTFTAVAVRNIYRDGANYDVVLLAPQVSFLYENVKAALRGTVVIEIPPSIFGSYDAAATIELVKEELEKARKTREENAVHRIMRGEDTNACVLSIVVKQSSEMVEIGWRVYEKGVMEREGVVIKHAPMHDPASSERQVPAGASQTGIGLADFTDIIDTVMAMGDYPERLDAIGIAMPGSVDEGVVTLPFTKVDGVNVQAEIEQRYGKPTVVSNNVNAAAFGWYSQQEDYQTVIFHSQSYGLATGGQGIVVNGELVTGLHGLSGELQHFYPALGMKGANGSWEWSNRMYDPFEIVDLLAKVFAIDVGILAPEVICVRSRLTPNMDDIRDALAQYVPKDKQPKLVYIPHFTDYIYIGLFVLALRKIRNL